MCNPKCIALINKNTLTIKHTYQIFQHREKVNFIFVTCIMLFVLANVLLDFLHSLSQSSSFYISESLLFSSCYWLLFMPLVTLVLKMIQGTERLDLKLLLVKLASICHLFSYPALVFIISKIFYYHTFDYWQTFNFGLSAYFIKTVIVYGFSFLAFTLINKSIQLSKIENDVEAITDKQNFISSILIVDNNNKKLLLKVNDIFYFSANSPYISIYISQKKVSTYRNFEVFRKAIRQQTVCTYSQISYREHP